MLRKSNSYINTPNELLALAYRKKNINIIINIIILPLIQKIILQVQYIYEKSS